MVGILKLKFSILQLEVLRFFCLNSGDFFNLQRIADRIGVSPPGVAKAVKALEKDGWITVVKDRESGRFQIGLDRENSKVIAYKRAENLKMLYEIGLVDCLYGLFPGATIILFGSYSFGEDVKGSDVDMAIIGANEKKVDILRFEQGLGREISLNFYNSLGKIDKNLRNNILNGIVIKGSVDV